MSVQPFKLTAVSMLIASATAIAETDQLPMVTVESYATEQFRLAPGTSHWDSSDLQRSGQRELSKVLRGLPGLSMSQGSVGTGSNLTLRGASGGLGVVNIDGIPLHDTIPGMTSLELFPAEMFGGMDVVRGSANLLDFGRNLGGTIHLKSREARNSGGGLHLEGGSFGSLRETATADLVGDGHSLNLTAGRDDIFEGTSQADPLQGNSERDDFHAYQLAMHLQNRLGDKARLDSSLYYLNGDSAIDKIGLLKPTPEFGFTDDPGQANQQLWLTQSKLGIDIDPKWHSSLQLGYTQHQVDLLFGSPRPGAQPYPLHFDNQLFLARWKNSHRLWLDSEQKRGLLFNWGGEGIYEQGRGSSMPLPNVLVETGGQRGTGSGFANLQIDWDDWQTTLATRADHFDDYGSHAVFHIGQSWQMTPHWQWFASGGTGFRPPSFSERLLWPFANDQLTPESSAGGEFGARWQPNDDSRWSVNYFQHQYRNLIKSERLAHPLGIYQRLNIPNSRIRGIEAQWSQRWNEQLSNGIDYTWTESENIDTGKPLPRQPEHLLRVWGEWRWQTLPLTLWGQGIYRGTNFDTGDTVRIPGCFYLDLQLSYQLSKPLNLYVRGENLTDERQAQFIGRGVPGAAVFGGFKWAFQ